MKRKLKGVVLLGLSLATPQALALGVGALEVHSHLGAPLEAAIPLYDTRGLDPAGFQARLADAQTYARAGLPRSAPLGDLDFRVERRGERLVLVLDSRRPINEPYLDLLIDLAWPGGQQLRQITLLLDPPDYRPLVEPAAPRVPATPATPAPAAAPPLAASPAAPSPAAQAQGDPAFVRSGDTLWAVASRLRPDRDVGMQQMMLALVAANPEVFPNGNINQMRAGFTLSVPRREALVAISPAEAERLVQAHHRAWANRGGGAPAPVAMPALDEALAPREAPPPESGEAAAQAEAEPGSEASGGETPASPAESAAPAAREAEGEAVASSAGNEQAAPRLVLLSDAELAAEQSAGQADEEGAGEPVFGESVAEDAKAAALAATDGPAEEEGVVEVAPAQSGEPLLAQSSAAGEGEPRPAVALAELREERDELRGEITALRDEMAALREQLAALAAGGGADGAGLGGVVPPDSATPAEGAPAQDRPWWGALWAGARNHTLALGGAALALLLALWALLRRRREEDEGQSFAERYAASPVPEGDPARAVPGPVQTERRAIPEAQAISEADIFIAYGRYDQARELLEASLARDPERDDLRLKLMTVLVEQHDWAAARREGELLEAHGDPALAPELARLQARIGAEGGEPEGASVEPDGEAAQAESSGRRIESPREHQGEPSAAEAEAPRSESPERIIDYRPPRIEPAEPRGETPRQPEVEFTPGDEPANGEIPHDWEVEELAFPASDLDNKASAAAPAAQRLLAEAQALLETGERERAAELLARVVADGDDQRREQARALIAQHNL
ncbi:tetratricopeptide repeat protein [Halomonas pacifica]|uniref:FimV/HubP family polar landmark protein n=1 Tax=Bisbaumannia pacifica TaxID=77098 RepID=UPI0023597870|nr:FimV/HubP family polar landmark protein [Halomonas pacifica]MDC8804006.1 tetratricopeptide repeat protein [Halomonas pacifica]